MQISVVIPVYNRNPNDAVQSVLKQTKPAAEIILVDDHPSPSVPASPHYRLLHSGGKGVSSARNLGIKSATYNWIALLDSDDLWDPSCLEAKAEYLSKFPSTLWIFSHENWVYRGRPKKNIYAHPSNLFEASLQRCSISPSTVMIHRHLFEQCGLFDERFPVCEDYDLWLRFLIQEEPAYLSDPLTTKQGGHPGQLSQQHTQMDYWRLCSLFKIYPQLETSDPRRECVQKEIEIKWRRYERGAQKHLNFFRLKELIEQRQMVG